MNEHGTSCEGTAPNETEFLCRHVEEATMRFATLARDGRAILAARRGDDYVDLSAVAPALPATLRGLIVAGEPALARAREALDHAPDSALIPIAQATYLPPILDAEKYLCLGLNYVDHAAESPYAKPSYPVLFPRYATSLVGANAPLLRWPQSTEFDYEGELVAVIGMTARNVPRERALDHVFGYSICNDGSYRDYQFKTPQWTVGKNFDGSGPFGPEVVTADELPPGATGLRLRTTLNGTVMQDASTDDMIFGVAETIAIVSEVMTLVPGDVLVMGTPAGVGFARKPPVFMKDGDHVEVSIERIGVLANPVRDAVPMTVH
jgi:acylpyruvate hydrolase